MCDVRCANRQPILAGLPRPSPTRRALPGTGARAVFTRVLRPAQRLLEHQCAHLPWKRDLTDAAPAGAVVATWYYRGFAPTPEGAVGVRSRWTSRLTRMLCSRSGRS